MYDNASLNKPEVLIQDLDAGQAYIATVTALNKKVRSAMLDLPSKRYILSGCKFVCL